jgi:excisionase family DNA binding protein
MAGKLIPLTEAAALLGVSADRLNELRQSNEIYGYRDGASWKFKQEDVERLKESLDGGGSAGSSNTSFDDLDFALPMGDEKDDLMLAPDFDTAPSSDVKMGSEQIRNLARGDSDLTLSSPSGSAPAKGSGSDVSLASDLIKGLMGDSEVTPVRSSGTMRMQALTDGAGADDDEFVLGSPIESDGDLSGSKTVLKAGSGLFGSGPIQLGGENVLDAANLSSAGHSSIGLGDDDNVLGGTGSGSDITHRPGDSGILLIDPADSGLSLEAPPSLSGSRSGIDGTIDFQSGAEDDFLLKPLDEGGDEDSESGSQVIMLDSEGSFDEKSSTLIADSLPGMPGGMNMDFGSPMGGGLSGGGMGMSASPAPQAVIPPGMIVVPKETPFSMFSVVGLVACTLVLALGGMMMFDLMRNIWSWDSPYSFSSAIMDSLVGRS